MYLFTTHVFIYTFIYYIFLLAESV